jgi:hypothetical protein
MAEQYDKLPNENEIQSGLTTSKDAEVMAQAVNNLAPKCEFGIRKNDSDELYLVHKGGDALPSDSAVDTEIASINTAYAAKDYYRSRAKEYIAIGNQLDLLWHDIDADSDLKTKLSGFYDAIKATKDKYPKS